jgi:hypothetical protein
MNVIFKDVTKSADCVISSMLSCFGGFIDH